MSQVDKLQDAEEHVNQLQEEAARAEHEARRAALREAPLADTAGKAHATVAAPLAQVRTMTNMRVGLLPDVHELAVSIRETGVLHPPLVRATGDAEQPYELLAGRRRFAAMQLLDEADGSRDDWRFTLVEGISRREALTMQFAENFHQSKPEPIQFARAARAIMAEDESLTAADVSRLVGAPPEWTRKALRMLDLPDTIVARVEGGDLSFTVADLVRRGIAKGDVSAAQAEELVAEHAAGRLNSADLKFGVGYVPAKPKGYDELSRELDEARWAGERAKRDGTRDEGVEVEQRDWEGRGGASGAGSANGGGAHDAGRAGSDGPAQSPHATERFGAGTGAADGAPTGEELDAYVLGLFLARLATDERRTLLRIVDEADAHDYALSLRPAERVSALRSFARERLAGDPDAPVALRRRG